MIRSGPITLVFTAALSLGGLERAVAYGSHPPAAAAAQAAAPTPAQPEPATPSTVEPAASGPAETKPSPAGTKAEERAVEAYGASNLACAEWTDGCMVCLKGPTETPSCSLPGIACEPKPVSCKKPIGVQPMPEAKGSP